MNQPVVHLYRLLKTTSDQHETMKNNSVDNTYPTSSDQLQRLQETSPIPRIHSNEERECDITALVQHQSEIRSDAQVQLLALNILNVNEPNSVRGRASHNLFLDLLHAHTLTRMYFTLKKTCIFTFISTQVRSSLLTTPVSDAWCETSCKLQTSVGS